MSAQNNSKNQYKDALKLLRKKCQNAETQYNEMKTKYESLESTIVGFLEYITKPFDESNLQPDLTNVGLRCWWDLKKEGLFLESKKDATPVSNGTPSELQSKVTELTSSLMKAEFEKKDLQFNLDKRSKEYKAVCDELEHMKSSFQTQKQQLEESTQAVADANATLSNLRSQIVSLFISFSQFLDVDCEREDDLKPALYSTVQNAFPEGSHSSDSNVEVMVLSAVDRVTMLKSRLRSIEGELKAKSNLLASQTKQISDLEGVSQSDRVLISRLQAKLDAQSSAVAESATQSSESGEMAELKHANEVLREAMGSLQTTLHQEQKRAEAAEARLVQVQADLVGVQRSSNESVQQMQQAAEEKAAAVEKEKEQLQLAADAAAVEAAGLREALERTRKEYEQELAVLREKKSRVEEQVTVSERFLAVSNQTHREELNRLLVAQQEAQQEAEAMKMTLMEKEEQLRSSASNYEALREQGRAQVGELTRQVAQLRGALAEEKAKREEEQRALEACEKKMEGVIEARVVSAQQKEKESSRQMQRGFEEELVRVRKQVQVLSHQLEEERKGERKTREQLAELAEELTTHEETIESLRSEIARKDSELLAGKQQINKLSAFISRRVGE
ncbi:hypothetical protein WA577_001831, partial [Blastocystis sp. JDR]